MYNEFRNIPGNAGGNSDGEVFDGKSNNRYTTIWGNWFHDTLNPPNNGHIKNPSAEFIVANDLFDGLDCKRGNKTGCLNMFARSSSTS
jgi:hypothetical protein